MKDTPATKKCHHCLFMFVLIILPGNVNNRFVSFSVNSILFYYYSITVCRYDNRFPAADIQVRVFVLKPFHKGNIVGHFNGMSHILGVETTIYQTILLTQLLFLMCKKLKFR